MADQRKKASLEAKTPGTDRPSLINKNNIDSNFFNSMLAGGSSEKKTPNKTDDIFGFLNQTTDPKSKEDPFSSPFETPMSTGKNKNEEDIFAMLSGSKKNEKPKSKSKPKNLKNLIIIEE